jgi:hypothetical protein
MEQIHGRLSNEDLQQRLFQTGATSEFPQSVQISFVPVTVLSWTSCTVFEWHLTHSLDTVSGFVISACGHPILHLYFTNAGFNF